MLIWLLLLLLLLLLSRLLLLLLLFVVVVVPPFACDHQGTYDMSFLFSQLRPALKLLSPLHGDQIQNTVSPYQTDPRYQQGWFSAGSMFYLKFVYGSV